MPPSRTVQGLGLEEKTKVSTFSLTIGSDGSPTRKSLEKKEETNDENFLFLEPSKVNGRLLIGKTANRK